MKARLRHRWQMPDSLLQAWRGWKSVQFMGLCNNLGARFIIPLGSPHIELRQRLARPRLEALGLIDSLFILPPHSSRTILYIALIRPGFEPRRDSH